MVDASGECSVKCAELDFIIVARIEKCDLASLVEPLFQRCGWQFRRCAARRVDALNAKGDDLFFYPNQHSREWLVGAFAEFWCQSTQAGNAAQFSEKDIDALSVARNEEVNSLGAEQDRSLQCLSLAEGDQSLAEFLEIG